MPTKKSLRLVVAINPTASFGKGRDVGPAVVQTLRALGHDVTSLQEPDFDQLMAAGAKAVAAKPDALIVVGGDGMVNLGTNLVARTKVPLGIVPSGTGNDMARHLGIPHENAEHAIGVLLESLTVPAQSIDAGLVHYVDEQTGEPSSRWFLCVLSAGFDAIVNERANLMTRPKGASRYTIALALELARLRPISYRLVLDGEVIETTGALVSVGNASSIGGGMRVTPDAKVHDGLFDVLVVQSLSRLSFLRVFPSVFKGEHVSDPRVTIHRAKRVRIESDGIVAYADGERIARLPIDIEIVPKAIRILAPTLLP
ncbi:YegS/Rv2252/BmrU family lipid kinase [Leifsonia sp. H3M29-4]|uniref:diacylglycerol/lipid kinase family protein n=1 Tax=Salinibacterium metalliresistens TaxID=3031321 RepID=UPI0023DA3029|nr:YegS/Rv2252/BmrU family lipid kinase [Salinibacterium metalliresistens]MDF1479333.1 YegS/Rv2252/BmrU family lipid kinase [Salinibacterium metalliresistens]